MAQWERIERTKAALHYLEYRLGQSEQHRASHVEKSGMILSVDSPFWDELMPPNGCGCACWVRQVTKREAERRGISTTPDVPDTQWVNPRTGDRRIVPVGIDPGWERNPGKLRRQSMDALLAQKIEQLPADVAQAGLRDIATSWAAERVLAGQSPASVPIALLPRDLAQAAGINTSIVRMTSDYGDKFRNKKRLVTTATLLELNDAAQSGEAVLDDDDGKLTLYLLSKSEKPWLFILKLLPDQSEIWVRTIHLARPNKLEAIKQRTTTRILRE